MLGLAAFVTLVVGELTHYCLRGEHDFAGGAQRFKWLKHGWVIHGSGGVHGKQSFDLLGGYVKFVIDTGRAQGGVNNNFYTSSPEHWRFPHYCDIQSNSSPTCMEMDIVENNGNCISQTTWHTWPNKNGGCDQGGCTGKMYASGRRSMKAKFSNDGWMTVYINGRPVDVNSPRPSGNAKKYVAQQMRKNGVQFQSSQWVGWVPGGNCPGGRNIKDSAFMIDSIIVYGKLKQGHNPTKCTKEQLAMLEAEHFALESNGTAPLAWEPEPFGLEGNATSA